MENLATDRQNDIKNEMHMTLNNTGEKGPYLAAALYIEEYASVEELQTIRELIDGILAP